VKKCYVLSNRRLRGNVQWENMNKKYFNLPPRRGRPVDRSSHSPIIRKNNKTYYFYRIKHTCPKVGWVSIGGDGDWAEAVARMFEDPQLLSWSINTAIRIFAVTSPYTVVYGELLHGNGPYLYRIRSYTFDPGIPCNVVGNISKKRTIWLCKLIIEKENK